MQEELYELHEIKSLSYQIRMIEESDLESLLLVKKNASMTHGQISAAERWRSSLFRRIYQ